MDWPPRKQVRKSSKKSGSHQEEISPAGFSNQVGDIPISKSRLHQPLPSSWSHLFPKGDPPARTQRTREDADRSTGLAPSGKETRRRGSSEGTNNNSPWGSSKSRGRTTSGPPRFRQFERELVGPQSSPSARVQYEIRRKCKFRDFKVFVNFVRGNHDRFLSIFLNRVATLYLKIFLRSFIQ